MLIYIRTKRVTVLWIYLKIRSFHENNIKFLNWFFCFFLFVFSGRDDWWRLLRSIGPTQVQFDTRSANRMDGFENDWNVQNASYTWRKTNQSNFFVKKIKNSNPLSAVTTGLARFFGPFSLFCTDRNVWKRFYFPRQTKYAN